MQVVRMDLEDDRELGARRLRSLALSFPALFSQLAECAAAAATVGRVARRAHLRARRDPNFVPTLHNPV